MVVADAARERPPCNACPELSVVRIPAHIAGDDAALRAEERLVRGGGDDVSPLVERFLEVWSKQAEDMGCIIQDNWPRLDISDYPGDLLHRLAVQGHALAQDK